MLPPGDAEDNITRTHKYYSDMRIVLAGQIVLVLFVRLAGQIATAISITVLFNKISNFCFRHSNSEDIYKIAYKSTTGV